MGNVATVARIALGAIVLAEVAGAYDRQQERRRQYEAASARAWATGRMLVVVGNPNGGAQSRLAPAYGCGDLCVDLVGCPACPVAETVDLTSSRTSVPDDGAVVFVSCVLEYVKDPVAAAREIARMAGSPENLFMVGVQPWTLTSVFYPGARQTIRRTPRGRVVAVPVTTTRKVVTATALVALGVAAVKG